MQIVETKYNGTYPIKMPEQRAEALALNGATGWEKQRIDSMHKTIKKGDVVYYVGAEQGDIPALLATWGAQLVIVEASDLMWGNIKTMFECNDVKPLEIFRGFASNKTTGTPNRQERLDFYDTIESGWKKDPGFYELHASKNVKETKIDDLVASGTPPPDMITMDVEGSEFEVLKGAEQTIKKHKPDIYLSLHPEFLIMYWNKYSREVRNWIMDRGYSEKLLAYEHEVHLYYEAN